MNCWSSRARHACWPILLVMGACASPVFVDVAVVNPCNQDAIGGIDLLRFEPRGAGIDSTGLSTVHPAENTRSPELSIPLVEDFRLFVTGHQGDVSAPASAFGVSAMADLSAIGDRTVLRLALGTAGSFYRTTDLESAIDCTSMAVPRYGATATLLPSTGQILIFGGAVLRPGAAEPEFTNVIELYDPATGAFVERTMVSTGGARAFHTATLLADGRVLIAGGESFVSSESVRQRSALRSAIIVDPRDAEDITFSGGIEMPVARSGHSAERLADGRVVFIGGRAFSGPDESFVAEIDIYDPGTGQFRTAAGENGGARLLAPRYGHSATLLTTGRDVVVVGGYNSTGPVRSLEVVSVSSEVVQVFAQPSKVTSVGPIFHAATRTDDGRVLLAGGYNTLSDAAPVGAVPRNPSVNVEMWSFNDARNELEKSCTAAMVQGRGRFTATAVGPDVLLAGGRGPEGYPVAHAELASLSAGGNCFTQTPELVAMAEARAEHNALRLSSGQVLVLGGRYQAEGQLVGTSISSAEIFTPRAIPAGDLEGVRP